MITNIEELKKYLNLNKKSHKPSDIKCEKCEKEDLNLSYQRLKRILKFNKILCRGCRCSQTMLERYGYNNNFQNKQNIEKIKQTKIKKYGSIKEAYKNTVIKSKQTKKERYGDEKYTNSEKRKQTCLEKYGFDNPFGCKEIHQKTISKRNYKKIEEKRKRTCLEKYGTTSFCNKDLLNKAIIKKYGSLENYYKFKQEKIEESNLKKYGVKSTLMLDSIRKKSEQTKIKKYGTAYSFYRSLYIYNNLNFDSSWELAYYIWLVDTKQKFIYKPQPIIWLDKNKKEHYYYPDFLIDDIYYEIKGDHLITEDNVLIDPFNKRILKEKSEIIKSFNVKIIKSKDIKPILSYVSQKYGNHYLYQFKNGKKYE
jgi:hypothetical protein